LSGAGDTIYAHSSGRPPAAIAVIRVSGPQAHEQVARLCGRLPPARQAAVRNLHELSGELLDQALVLRFDAPASATGEDLIELHCHGGRAVVDAVLGVLGSLPGLREAQPGEFTRRSFENGRIDLTQTEGLADLLEAETETQRRAALAVSGGAIRRQVEHWRERLLQLSARAEAAIDYVDDEEETASDLDQISTDAEQLGAEIAEWLQRPRAEPLRDGIRVVLAGPPNSGKSSLLNHLTGRDKAIVSPEAGTTRDVIEAPIAWQGVPFLLVDTAGIRSEAAGIERTGIERAEQQVGNADILLWLGAPENAPDHPRLLRLHSQVDLPERRSVPENSLAVSVVSGTGLDELVHLLLELAKSLLPDPGAVPLNTRQAAALCHVAVSLASASTDHPELTAEVLRQARADLDLVTGQTGVEDVLDALFGRFCLGK
jgi:tRNA modification GTPase